MKNELGVKRVALTLAIVAGIAYIVCALVFALAPETVISLAQSLFHGIDITQISETSVSFGRIIVGLIQVFVYAFVVGGLFAVIYNKLK